MYYIRKFDSAIRFQIARSAERSYESLKLTDAVNLLRLKNTEELTTYIRNDIENIEVNILLNPKG